MEGFDSYCLQIERATVVKTGIGFYNNIIFMGQFDDKCYLIANHLLSGKVFKKITNMDAPYETPLVKQDKETGKWVHVGWTDGKLVTGWKKGARKDKPLIFIDNH
jgi:hypothetical protein